jgi:2-polyprenyl-3-methyl-5-hydroxy-6-metoxy-1,4-benzoquinol methylase
MCLFSRGSFFCIAGEHFNMTLLETINVNNDSRHNYEYTFGLNEGHAGAYVVRMVGKRKRVLEIGAGPGSITKLLRNTNGCRITALEIDSEAIKRLMPFCERVYQADLNDPSWPRMLLKEGVFDVVVAADVLEHLNDPLTTLKEMKGLIGENGYLVISLPHVGHCAIIACLLDGDFDYRDWGLLDSTHIRFFGIKNIQALFDNAGLKIVDTQFVIKPPEETEFAAHWGRLSNEIRNVISATSFAFVYQVVIKAVTQESDGMGVRLMSFLPVDASKGDVITKGRVQEALKKIIRSIMGPKAWNRIRRIAKSLGVGM